MIYGGVISTPANTAASSPVKTVYQVTEGIVYHLEVIFPPGSCGLLHVQVFDASYQMFPTTLGESFSGDNYPFKLDVLYAKDDSPFQFTVVTWNLDDTYSHDVSVFLSLETSEDFKARYLPMLQTSGLVAALGKQEIAKSESRRERLAKFLESMSSEGGE